MPQQVAETLGENTPFLQHRDPNPQGKWEKNEWYLEVNYIQIMPRDSGKQGPSIANYSNENKGNPPKKAKMQPLWINVRETLLNKWFCIRWRNSCASLVAQMVKNLPAMQEIRVRSPGREDPLEKGMATHSSILAQRIPWTEEPGWLQSMRSQRVRRDWGTNT